MVKVERSAHVKAQLLALERFVHALRQKYDALVTERRQRQRDLYRSNEVFALLLKAQAGTGSEGRLRDVEKRCEDTDTLLERELLYTETLDHMLGTMKKCILAAALPTQPMLRQLTRARIANGVENCDVGVTEHDVERLRSEVKSLKKAFVMQHTKHSAATQAMLERYSYQKEFVVLCEEQQKQFVIRDSIAELQEEERRALGLLREAKSVEEMKRHADELTEQAQKQKEALGQLFQVARLQNADDIINYFQFLRESANTLDATRATLEERIASLRLSLLEATAEFKAAAETSVVSVPGFNRVDSLEAEVKAAERGEEARIEKVRWLQRECGCMQELLLDLLQRTDFAQKPLDGLDVPSLLTLLQTSLLKLQEEIAPETHRTAATDESELA